MWWVLVGLAILMLVWSNREHMTNEDLLAGLKQMGSPSPPKKDSKDTPSEAPIYGPRVPKLAHPDPDPAGTSEDGAGLYPQIYGPDVPLIPGKKPGDSGVSGKQSSDKATHPLHQFNPDLVKAFPTSGEPEPYLNDFSKIQK